MLRIFSVNFRQLVCAVLLSLAISAPSFAEKQVILVLDASGSMWGQIDGKAKISIAREVVDDMVSSWEGDNKIGLIAYGHRSKGDCADIESLIPVGKLDKAAFKSAVAALQPKGKTPLTDAVRKAAQQLKYTENEATVILLSDGKETCDADPCAVAAELESSGIKFTAHVIGFDVADAEGLSQLQCMASNTGGEFLAAKDASSLKAALQTAVKKVEEKPQVDASAPVDIRLSAVFSEGGAEVDRNDFRVYREVADDFGKIQREQVARDYYKQEVFFNLVPGDYIAATSYGDAHTESPFTLEPGKKLNIQLNYNAGRVQLSAALAEGSGNIGRNDIRLYRESLDDFGKATRTQISRDYYKEEVLFTVPAGDYVAQSLLGAAVAEAPISVKAGEAVSTQLIYNAGRVKLNAVLAEGKDKVGRNDIRVYRVSVDEFGKTEREQLARDYYKEEVVFIIPAGELLAESILGSATIEKKFSIEPGSATEHTLVYNAGRLKITSARQAGGAQVGRNDFRVYREDTDDFGESSRTQIARDYYKEEVIFVVPAGEYVVESLTNGLTGTVIVSVPAGGAVHAEVILSE